MELLNSNNVYQNFIELPLDCKAHENCTNGKLRISKSEGVNAYIIGKQMVKGIIVCLIITYHRRN